MGIVDWLFVALYLVLLVIIGVQTTRRVQNPEDFAVAGNRFTWPALFAALSAAIIGGAFSFGNASSVFQDGYVFMFALFGFSLQAVLVGYFVAPRLKDYRGAQTVGDIMGAHYGRTAQLLTGIFSVIFCAGILGAQALAMGSIFASSLGTSASLGIVLGMGIILVYSTTGGMWAVMQTENLQFVFLGIFLPVALLIGVSRIGGPAELINSVPDAHFSFLGDLTAGAFLSVFIGFFFGEALAPPYTQRAFSAPDSANAKRAFVAAGFFSFFFLFVTASIGLVGLVLFPDTPPDQILPTVVGNILPVGITGLVIAALLAVIMSSGSAFLNSTAVVFAKDIFVPFVRPDASSSQVLWVQRVVTALVGVGAIIFALTAPSIIDAILLSYLLWAPTIIIPLIAAVVWGLRGGTAAVSAMVGGGASAAVWQWGLGEPFGVSGLVVGLVTNLVILLAVYNLVDKREASSTTAGEVASREEV